MPRTSAIKFGKQLKHELTVGREGDDSNDRRAPSKILARAEVVRG
jgi:hypothetical protein